MDVSSIVNVLIEQSKTIEEIKMGTKKLNSLNELVTSLSSAYPDLFAEAKQLFRAEQPLKNNIQSSEEFARGWDVRVSLRRRVLSLLIETGRFMKVSELAKMAMSREPVFTTETEETLQTKISRTLTALKKIEALGIEKRKIHSGSNGFAWGLARWEEDGFMEREHQKMLLTEQDGFDFPDSTY